LALEKSVSVSLFYRWKRFFIFILGLATVYLVGVWALLDPEGPSAEPVEVLISGDLNRANIFPGKQWERVANPAEVGFDPVKLRQARSLCPSTGAAAVVVERNFNDYDLAAGFREELDFQADVIIIALGENAVSLNTDELRSQFHAAFTNLLDIFKKQGQPAIFVRGTFWLDEDKNSIMRKACEESGGFFVDNSKLGNDEANFARSERQIDHSGVAGHPGDKGMQAIADSIWIEIEKQAKLDDIRGDP
jgi:hypothetical protein